MSIAARSIVASFVVGFPFVVGSASAQYVPASLGSLPGQSYSYALDVNDRGDAVGVSGNGATGDAVLWTGGRVVPIPSLNGLPQQGIAFAINNRRQIVGTSRTASGEPHGFLYAAGALTDLGTLPGDTSSGAAAINERGDVTGTSYSPFRGTSRLVLWEGGVIHDLGDTPYGTGTVMAMNARRQIVGYSGTTTTTHAWIWQDGAFALLPLPSWATAAYAWSINDRGQVAGVAFGPAGYQGVVWTDGGVVALGVLPGHLVSWARAINNRGQVVGFSSSPLTARTHAFLWRAGTMIDLGPLPGGDSAVAHGISDAGHIVGESNAAEGGVLPVLWTLKVRGR